MYESVNALKFGQTYNIYANGLEVGTFDDDGEVTIDENWDDIPDLKVTHSDDGLLNFEVEISVDTPAITIGAMTIHTTRTDTFSIICSYADNFEVSLDDDLPVVHVEVTELGTSGPVESEPKEPPIWSDSFDLNVYSDDQFKSEVTSDEPISIGSPAYSLIQASKLPKALQYFVSKCEVKASNEENEKHKVSVFESYECFNPVFGDSESIFMGRPINTGSNFEDDFEFSFPAFTFNVAQDDELHMVSFSFIFISLVFSLFDSHIAYIISILYIFHV